MDPSYPIGPFENKDGSSADDRARWLAEIADLPALLRTAVNALPSGGLDRSYREGVWTARQVVHHLADSHLNSYVRFRLALTEDEPTIKPYDQNRWANLEDARAAPVELSLGLLDTLHERWVMLLESLSPHQWMRTLYHPEIGRIDLDYLLQLYAWHGRHHTAHLGLIR